MNKFIYLNPTSIPTELCDDIIEYYYANKSEHYDGQTRAGTNKSIKDTTDMVVPPNNRIHDFLVKELHNNLIAYFNQIKSIREFSLDMNKNDYTVLKSKCFLKSGFMIQKYEKNKGKYIYHNDFEITNTEHRVITYLWYLNDVECGGETEIWNDIRIKPEKGKLLLFPSDITFPHCGLMPLSSDKIIITGWLYNDNKSI